MVTVLRDGAHQLIACCEWWCVTEKGLRWPDGRYVYVNHLEMNPGIDGQAAIRQLIGLIALEVPWAMGAYWDREWKYGTQKLHGFRRHRLLQHSEEVSRHVQ